MERKSRIKVTLPWSLCHRGESLELTAISMFLQRNQK
jgi:hypothetical protein